MINFGKSGGSGSDGGGSGSGWKIGASTSLITNVRHIIFLSSSGFHELQFNRGQVNPVPEQSWPKHKTVT